jgi:hypothetical protein
MGIGHRGLLFAAEVIARSSYELVKKQSILSDAWKEFDGQIKGKKYLSPLPNKIFKA